MRKSAQQDSITVQAITGTHCVILGMNDTADAAKGLLGFSILREDNKTHKIVPLRGRLTFPDTGDHPAGPNSLDHPIQSYQWSDYGATPDTSYTYTVIPVRGTPSKLEPGTPVKVSVSTESETDPHQNIFFNRGAVAGESFGREFAADLPKSMKQMGAVLDSPKGKKMRTWLSRGLEDALLNFIGQAKGKNFGLRAAVYEFTWQPVLKAFKAAAATGADVHLMVAGQKTGGTKSIFSENDGAVIEAGLTDKNGRSKIMEWRDNSTIHISHNKFVVLLKGGKPVAVWTGSTNMTDGGIFGQSNVGHVVNDAAVAAAYLKYWETLKTNPDVKAFSSFTEQNFKVPKEESSGIQVVFSPREKVDALNWYASQVQSAKDAAFITLPFGIGAEMMPALTTARKYLKFVLMDTRGVPALSKNFGPVSKVPWNRVAVGEVISAGILELWNKEQLTDLNDHVRFVHTKYMLIDPLSASPLVVTGSANFSKASILNNDENSLVIHKDARVADIYLTEFMRQFVHFSFADHVMGDASSVKGKAIKSKTTKPGPGAKRFLAVDDSWTKAYKAGTAADKMRQYFSGQS